MLSREKRNDPIARLAAPSLAVRLVPSIIWRALRVHQWAKNVLVFVPLVLGGRAADADAWVACLVGFVAISTTCSGTYLINDLRDLEHDRQHHSKRWRPIPSGELAKSSAVAIAVGSVMLGITLAALLGLAALTVLLAYLVVTLAYTFFLKRIAIVDVFAIASLFTLRLVLGIAITDVRLSPWLLVFSMFTFLSLSLAKRYTEVQRIAHSRLEPAFGRGYLGTDAPLILGFGMAASLGSVLILVLYLIEDAFPSDLYVSPQYLWALPAILFLLFGRIWLQSQRDELDDDPVEFVLKDFQSLVYAGAALVAMAAALMPQLPTMLRW